MKRKTAVAYSSGQSVAVFCCDDCAEAAKTRNGGIRRDLGRNRRKLSQ